MLKKILICVLMVLVVVGTVVSVVALRDNITKIETNTGDKSDSPDDIEQPEEDDNRLYKVTISPNYAYAEFMLMSLDDVYNGDYSHDYVVDSGSSFECKTFSVRGCSAGGEFYLYKTASGERGWFEAETIFELTEDITILYAVDGDIVRESSN